MVQCFASKDTTMTGKKREKGQKRQEHDCCGEREYEGLSEMFLSCPVPKLLLLAGTDRLDRCYLADTSLYISLVQHVVTDERSIATAESR
ncbi:hypothetical protein BHE74_00016864 [Ensete ventricosum]|nr:hypothetical protein BHE74_00016864 [Ensete ventricosum]RZR89002.1 hypothetical protein BHM03_00016655 [Ensete ventricosum]